MCVTVVKAQDDSDKTISGTGSGEKESFYNTFDTKMRVSRLFRIPGFSGNITTFFFGLIFDGYLYYDVKVIVLKLKLSCFRKN